MATREEKRRAEYHRMAEGLRRLEEALHGAKRGRDAVPEAWHDIAQDTGPGRKERVTLWVEADVMRFFRSMGKGHTSRMAEVLATFMHARLAGVVKGPEDTDYSKRLRTPEEEAYWDESSAKRKAILDRVEASYQRRWGKGTTGDKAG